MFNNKSYTGWKNSFCCMLCTTLPTSFKTKTTKRIKKRASTVDNKIKDKKTFVKLKNKIIAKIPSLYLWLFADTLKRHFVFYATNFSLAMIKTLNIYFILAAKKIVCKMKRVVSFFFCFLYFVQYAQIHPHRSCVCYPLIRFLYM